MLCKQFSKFSYVFNLLYCVTVQSVLKHTHEISNHKVYVSVWFSNFSLASQVFVSPIHAIVLFFLSLLSLPLLFPYPLPFLLEVYVFKYFIMNQYEQFPQ